MKTEIKSNEIINTCEYIYTMPKGKKQFVGIGHGKDWYDIKINIKKYHPKRSNLKFYQWLSFTPSSS